MPLMLEVDGGTSRISKLIGGLRDDVTHYSRVKKM